MPQALNQEVTVRRPQAKRMPQSNSGRREAERLSSQWARWAKMLVSQGGRCENGMAGSLGRRWIGYRHRLGGAGSRPPTRSSHVRNPPTELATCRITAQGALITRSRKVQIRCYRVHCGIVIPHMKTTLYREA